jgi:predicted nucleic acid-binding protein
VRLFGDSAAWLVFFDRHQPNHAALRQAIGTFSHRSVMIYVTDYVIDETLTLVLARAGHSAAVACGEWLLRSPIVKVVRIEPDQWDQAWALFRRYDDRKYSFTDCTSFVVMQQYKLVDAFTFDHHFEQMGFRLWPA